MQEALAKHPSWLPKYTKQTEPAPGEPLPYHPNFGLTKAEYAEMLATLDKVVVAPIGVSWKCRGAVKEDVWTVTPVEKQKDTLILGSLSVNIVDNTAKFYGIPLGKPEWGARPNNESPLGPWRGYNWEHIIGDENDIIAGGPFEQTSLGISHRIGMRKLFFDMNVKRMTDGQMTKQEVMFQIHIPKLDSDTSEGKPHEPSRSTSDVDGDGAQAGNGTDTESKPSARGITDNRSRPVDASSKPRVKTKQRPASRQQDVVENKSPSRTFRGPEVSGKIRGREFNPDRVVLDLRAGTLEFRQGNEFFPDLALTVFLFLEEGETPDGQRFDVLGDKPGNISNHIHVKWKVAGMELPKTKIIMDGYEMKLQFGDASNGKLPGVIKVGIPGDTNVSFVGKFDATLQ
jgi:hypothetical protein